MPYKILVTGDRHAKPEDWRASVYKVLEEIRRQHPTDLIIVVHGNAKGIDTIADDTAKQLYMAVRPYEANWRIYGRGAGPIRNSHMLEKESDVSQVIAFHDDLPRSSGTRDMVGLSVARGYRTRLFNSAGELIQEWEPQKLPLVE